MERGWITERGELRIGKIDSKSVIYRKWGCNIGGLIEVLIG